ncbi:Rv0361 family membrane protein [Actinopolyspora saharensis]|uniref:Rv0361 family membrane protein n=1 Tax=Actinopolyspora saharensis TaxID=995062 RepID=UPI003F66E7A8
MPHPPQHPAPGGHPRVPGNESTIERAGSIGDVGAPSPWGRFPGESAPGESPRAGSHAGDHGEGTAERGQSWTNPALAPHAHVSPPGALPELDPPPRRSRRPWMYALLATISVAALLSGYFLFFATDHEAPRETATRVVDKINSGRFAALDGELCDSNAPKLRRQLDQLSTGRFELSLGEVDTEGDTATARVRGTYIVAGTSQRVDQPLGLRLENGKWKVCDLAP